MNFSKSREKIDFIFNLSNNFRYNIWIFHCYFGKVDHCGFTFIAALDSKHIEKTFIQKQNILRWYDWFLSTAHGDAAAQLKKWMEISVLGLYPRDHMGYDLFQAVVVCQRVCCCWKLGVDRVYQTKLLFSSRIKSGLWQFWKKVPGQLWDLPPQRYSPWWCPGSPCTQSILIFRSGGGATPPRCPIWFLSAIPILRFAPLRSSRATPWPILVISLRELKAAGTNPAGRTTINLKG